MDPADTLERLASQLHARTGVVEGDLLENSETDLALALQFYIRVDFDDVVRDGRTDAVALTIGPLALAMRRWSDLARARWEPPQDRASRQADGATYAIGPSDRAVLRAGGDVIELRCRAITFGALRGGAIETRIALRHSDDGPAAGVPAEELDIALGLGAIRVLGDVFLLRRPDRDEALRLAAGFVDVDAFDVASDDDLVVLHPST